MRTTLAKKQRIDLGENDTASNGISEIHDAISRTLASQSALLEWIPERKEISEVTAGLCKAMQRTLESLGNNHSPFSWTQYMIQYMIRSKDYQTKHRELLDDKDYLEGIVLANGKNPLDLGEKGSTRRLMQAVISLTWHYYCTDTAGLAENQFFWVLAYGTEDEIQKFKQQLQDLVPDLRIWRHDPDGELRGGHDKPIPEEPWGPDFVCFGISHSSLFSVE